MKVKFTAKSSTIRHLISVLDLDKESQIDLIVDLVETPRNKSTLDKFKNCMTRLEGYSSKVNIGVTGSFVSQNNPINQNVNKSYGIGTYGRGNNPSSYSSSDLPSTLDELDERIRRIVYEVLDEENSQDYSIDSKIISTPTVSTNVFAGNFNPLNQNYGGNQSVIPSQVNLNQENDLINSLLKPNVCGVDLNTIQGIAIMTIAVLRTIDPYSYSISSDIIKSSIEWIRNGNRDPEENLSFDYSIINKMNNHLGVDEWKQRINRFLKYGTNVRSCSLSTALDYMYT